MKKPNVKTYNPDPDYLYKLIGDSGLPINEWARTIGHNHRTVRYWLSGTNQFSYPVQYIAEVLADEKFTVASPRPNTGDTGDD